MTSSEGVGWTLWRSGMRWERRTVHTRYLQKVYEEAAVDRNYVGISMQANLIFAIGNALIELNPYLYNPPILVYKANFSLTRGLVM